MMTTIAPSLDGLRFAAVENGSGEVDTSTVFTYHEDGELVWARYEGGGVRLGFLVGTRAGDALDFRYSQLNPAGETSSGHCRTQVTTLPDGRIRLEETWEWQSRAVTGTSVVEELRLGRGAARTSSSLLRYRFH